MKKLAKDKQKETRQDAEIEELLRKSRRVFLNIYAEDNDAKVSTLVAHVAFDQLLENGLPPSEAHRILNSKKELNKFLDIAEKKFLQSEQGRLSLLVKNTSFRSAMGAGVASGVVVGVVMSLASPFVTAWLQPTADELFKRSPQKIEAPAPTLPPAPIQAASPSPAQNVTTTNNYYFGKEEPAPKVPDQKGLKTKKKPNGPQLK